jgi:hypothetical protein
MITVLTFGPGTALHDVCAHRLAHPPGDVGHEEVVVDDSPVPPAPGVEARVGAGAAAVKQPGLCVLVMVMVGVSGYQSTTHA